MAETTPETPKKEEPPKAETQFKTTGVRVLVAFGDHAPNDVIDLTATDLRALKADGLVDDDPDAVAYAFSLKD